MSGMSENRWRRQGQANRQNQDRASGSHAPAKESGRPQSIPSPSGNTWAVRHKSIGSAPAAQDHTPVRDFNANEVKEFLRKKYMESTAGMTGSALPSPLLLGIANQLRQDQPSAYHKVQGDSVAKRSSGAWGVKGNMSHLMPSGQDFFTQLKKQLASMDQSKST